MRYLILNEHWAKDSNLPQYIAYSGDIMELPLYVVRGSDFIFHFDKDGNTIYYKDRVFDNYQYSDEDKVVLKLKCVLV